MEPFGLSSYLNKISQKLTEKTDSAIVLELSELAILFPSSGENPFSQDDIYYLQRSLSEAGLSSEPDISKHYRKLDLSGKIVVFKTTFFSAYPIEALLREKIFFAAIALFAKADGVLDKDELDYIHFCRKHRSAQSGIKNIGKSRDNDLDEPNLYNSLDIDDNVLDQIFSDFL